MVERHLRRCMPAVLRCAQIFSAMDLNPYRQHLKLAGDLFQEVCFPCVRHCRALGMGKAHAFVRLRTFVPCRSLGGMKSRWRRKRSQCISACHQRVARASRWSVRPAAVLTAEDEGGS